MDQHLVRLYSKDLMNVFNPPNGIARDFIDFYNFRYGTTNDTIPPAQWQIQNEEGKHNWEIAPRAAFPSYQFSVRTGSGLNLAIPIQGVPFALGIMNTGSASGTVTVADAYTFGLDNVHLESRVRKWARINRDLLCNYEPRDDQYHFLRVISRVYVAGRVCVTIRNDESTGAESTAGADRPINLLGISNGETKSNYAETLKEINLLAGQLPGARVKVATVSSRTITLSEQFERPLVVGYMGFDMPILRGGRLGGPISALAQLSKQKLIPSGSGRMYTGSRPSPTCTRR